MKFIGNCWPKHNPKSNRIYLNHDCSSWIDHFEIKPLSPEEFEGLWLLHPNEYGKVKIRGKVINTPRWQQTYGHNYHFSGMDHEAKDLPIDLQYYLDLVNETKYATNKFNEVFVNWYKDGNHYIGPHSDDESNLVQGPNGESIVCSITFQEEPGNRIFRIKPKITSKEPSRLDIPLTDGLVLVMGGRCQKTHTHQVPKTKTKVGRRINITFRSFDDQPRIESFKGKYSFLSNFHPSKVKFEGLIYPTSEHAFQAAKTLNMDIRKRFCSYDSPGIAKRMGRKIELRSDWEEVKVSTMKKIVKLKFLQHPVLTKRLLNTGNTKLIEGNTWNDTFWGVCRGKGENNLGKILMEVRDELKLKK